MCFVQMLALANNVRGACSGDAELEKQISDLSRLNSLLREHLLHSCEERKNLRGFLDAAELTVKELSRQNSEFHKVERKPLLNCRNN